MTGPGPRNAITDVPGILVGSAEDVRVRTGVTVLLCDRPSVAAVDVRGGGPGTRETDLLAPENLVSEVDAITLSGGSVYGLAAADAVVAALGARGRGFVVREGLKPAPIVPGAILFDLGNGGNKEWGELPPYQALARQALRFASTNVRLGSVGAGAGAAAGALKGGLGSASLVMPDGGVIGALAAANSWGSVTMPGSNAFWSWPFEIGGEFGGARPASDYQPQPLAWGAAKTEAEPRANTTIAIIASDYRLNKAEAKRLAIMAQDGLARAIRPAHAPFDGDVVFAVATGARDLAEPRQSSLARVGAAAGDVLARAIARGVYEAAAWDGECVWRDLRPDGSRQP